MKQIPAEHLYLLRTEVDVTYVIRKLKIPVACRGNRLTFRCPDCARFHTAMNLERNLAYCFPCRRCFNTIDLVMAERSCTFLEAVELLECLLG